MAIPSIVCAIGSAIVVGPLSQVVFMTMWGNNLTWITLVASWYETRRVENCEKANLKMRAWLLRLIEFAMSMEIVITIVYWVSIHEVLLKKL